MTNIRQVSGQNYNARSRSVSRGVSPVPPLANWIFADDTWSDAGVWQDVREWTPTGLFINGQWFDAGEWSDLEIW